MPTNLTDKDKSRVRDYCAKMNIPLWRLSNTLGWGKSTLGGVLHGNPLTETRYISLLRLLEAYEKELPYEQPVESKEPQKEGAPMKRSCGNCKDFFEVKSTEQVICEKCRRAGVNGRTVAERRKYTPAKAKLVDTVEVEMTELEKAAVALEPKDPYLQSFGITGVTPAPIETHTKNLNVAKVIGFAQTLDSMDLTTLQLFLEAKAGCLRLAEEAGRIAVQQEELRLKRQQVLLEHDRAREDYLVLLKEMES